mgnify:CR=1 FL=1
MIDILLITHNRLEYLKKALPSVLNQTYKDFNLIIWDNNSDKETVNWLYQTQPNVFFSNTNASLAQATTEVFLSSGAEFVGKVDSDVILPSNWIERLVSAHEKYHFGFLGGFHFRPEDLNGIEPNIEDYNGVKVWRKHHIGGNYIIRRADFRGYKGQGVMGLSEYQAEMGFINGYLWDPILWIEHMEDPRSEHFIGTEEYNQYKIKTRGVSLEKYATGIVNQAYMMENTKSG